MTTDNQAMALRKADRLLQTIRGQIDRSVSVEVAHAFILVALNEGASPSELAEMAGATKSAMSRYLLDLSERLRNGDTGRDLLQRVQDPLNMRSVKYILSPKGKLLKNSIVSLMGD